MASLLPPQTRKEVTVLRAMTKGERIVAEALGELPIKGEPIMTSNHPFLREVTEFMADRKEWERNTTIPIAKYKGCGILRINCAVNMACL